MGRMFKLSARVVNSVGVKHSEEQLDLWGFNKEGCVTNKNARYSNRNRGSCMSIAHRSCDRGELICSHVHRDQNQNKLFNKNEMPHKFCKTTFAWKNTKPTVQSIKSTVQGVKVYPPDKQAFLGSKGVPL